jgi:hypothetical protein
VVSFIFIPIFHLGIGTTIAIAHSTATARSPSSLSVVTL